MPPPPTRFGRSAACGDCALAVESPVSVDAVLFATTSDIGYLLEAARLADHSRNSECYFAEVAREPSRGWPDRAPLTTLMARAGRLAHPQPSPGALAPGLPEN